MKYKKLYEFYLNNNADPNIPDKFGKYPLQINIECENLNLIKTLIKSNKIDYNKKIKIDYNKQIKIDYNKKIKIDPKKENDAQYTTYLHLAAASNSSILRLLLNIDSININITNDLGETPLMMAIKYKKSQNIDLLFNRDDLDYLHKDNLGRDAIKIVAPDFSDNKIPTNKEQYHALLDNSLDPKRNNTNLSGFKFANFKTNNQTNETNSSNSNSSNAAPKSNTISTPQVNTTGTTFSPAQVVIQEKDGSAKQGNSMTILSNDKFQIKVEPLKAPPQPPAASTTVTPTTSLAATSSLFNSKNTISSGISSGTNLKKSAVESDRLTDKVIQDSEIKTTKIINNTNDTNNLYIHERQSFAHRHKFEFHNESFSEEPKQEEMKEQKQKQQNIEEKNLVESQLVNDNNPSGSIENLNNEKGQFMAKYKSRTTSRKVKDFDDDYFENDDYNNEDFAFSYQSQFPALSQNACMVQYQQQQWLQMIQMNNAQMMYQNQMINTMITQKKRKKKQIKKINFL